VSSKYEHHTRVLQACLWDMRRLIEGELRELTEAQERLEAFVAVPTGDRRMAMAAALDERFKTLVRTNENVLKLLYDACDGTRKLSED
jgi:hypothetical protein